jgi:hypothetical protein
MNIIEELENLGGSNQHNKVHKKAIEEIERLREAILWAIKDCEALTNHNSIKRELLEALKGET